MPLNFVYVATLPIAGAAAMATAASPPASAAGGDAVLADRRAKGYEVNINWVNGFDTEPLSECTVTSVIGPDHSGAPSRRVTPST